jgi:hypothetical protein
MTKQLFEVQFRVHPTPDHPQFGQIKFGLLIIWVYETDAKKAVQKGHYIAAALPYAVGVGKSFSIADGDKLEPYQLACVSKAKIIGGNLALLHWSNDYDETAVLHDWPLLVPPLPLPGSGLGACHD